MKDTNQNDFLKILRDNNFNSELEMQNFLAHEIPKLFGIKKERVITELKTTSFDGTLKNISDLVVLGSRDKNLVLVAFEFKLDKSIKQFAQGSYEDAKKQLHKYCQDLNSPYGVLLSETRCYIFKYKYYSSYFSQDRVDVLPPVSVIEKMITEKRPGTTIIKEIHTKEIAPKKENEPKKAPLVGYFFVGLLAFLILVSWYYNRPLSLENCISVRGNVSLDIRGDIKDKIYHIPGSQYYDLVKLKKEDGDKCFRTESEAIENGFRAPK